MKKIILILLSLVIYDTILAQDFKDFRLNFGFQGNFPEKVFNNNIPKYNSKNGGGGFHLYPKWFYNNQNSIGLNIEYVMVTENFQSDAIGVYDIISFCPTYNHYFFKSKIRPFVGIGIGSYSVLYHSPAFNFGIRPLVGISLSNYFDLSLEYNRILNQVNIDPKVSGGFDNYYFGLKGSFSIGLLKLKNKSKQ
jgi:hypothetical protein